MRIRKSAETRKVEIVEAALRLADKTGPNRLTTETIAAAVGLTQPAIFRHFPTKQDLWAAVAARIGAKMERRWARAVQADRSPTDNIRDLIHAQLRLIQATPAIPAILFSRELHTKNQGLRQAFFTLMGQLHHLIAGLIVDASEAGEIRPELDPDDAAFLILGLVQGLAIRWSISGRDFSLADEGQRLLELQLSGFATAEITEQSS